jgi:hypothetical protein
VHPAKPKIGLRTTRANEMWHIDTTVIRLLDGTRAYLHARDGVAADLTSGAAAARRRRI